MAGKADRFYYENLNAAAECSCRAADYLATSLINFQPAELKALVENLYEIEHAGDVHKHEMSAALSKAFVTPVDREDLALISQSIDNVTDCIEEVLQGLYMYRIQTILPDGLTFARKVADCCRLMKNILEEFPSFKRSDKLHDLVVELNHQEEECDRLYAEAIYQLHEQCGDVLTEISWREIYGRFESCADACEHVADCIETVIMKNT